MSHTTPPPGPPLPPGQPGQPAGPYPGPQYQPAPPKSRKTLWIVLGVLGATLVLCFGGCGVLLASGASDSVDTTESSNPDAPAGSAAPTSGAAAPKASAGARGPGDGPAPFGSTVTTNEDEAVTASYVGSRATKDTDYIEGPAAKVVTFKITMKNGSNGDINIGGLTSSQGTYGADGQVAKELLTDAPPVTIKPGRTGTTTVAFVVPKSYAGSFNLTISTSLAGDDVEFTGRVK